MHMRRRILARVAWAEVLPRRAREVESATEASKDPTCEQHISNTLATHVQHISNTCATHVQHMCNTCATHEQHMCNTCATH